MPVPITALYAAILTLLLIACAINVTAHRSRLKIAIGDGGNAQMQRMIRIHGNTVEYVPIGVLLMALYELDHGSPLALHILGIALIVGRLFFIAAFWNSTKPGALRVTAMSLTWLTLAALAALNLWQLT